MAVTLSHTLLTPPTNQLRALHHEAIRVYVAQIVPNVLVFYKKFSIEHTYIQTGSQIQQNMNKTAVHMT